MELKHKKSYAASEKKIYFASYSFFQDMITE